MKHSVFRSLTELLFPTTWFVWRAYGRSTDAFVWGGSNLEDADVRAIINASFTKLLAGDIDAPKL